MGGNYRQIGKGPLSALDVIFLGGSNLQKVTHRRRNHVLVVFKVIVEFSKAA